MKLDLADSGKHIERYGEVVISPDDRTIWKKYFFDKPDQIWYEAVVATDYSQYWIQYECEERKGLRIETAVLRHRERFVNQGQMLIFESLLEGLGYPTTNIVNVPQPPSCSGYNEYNI